jgi:hypothetical protein
MVLLNMVLWSYPIWYYGITHMDYGLTPYGIMVLWYYGFTPVFKIKRKSTQKELLTLY